MGRVKPTGSFDNFWSFRTLFILILTCSVTPLAAESDKIDTTALSNAKAFKNSASILVGPAFLGYRLRGSGFNATLPLTFGTFFGLSASREIASKLRLWSQYSKVGTDYAGLTGLTPSSVSFQQYNFEIGLSYDPEFQGIAAGLRLQLAYGFQWTRGDVTTPNAVLPSNDAMGPILGIGYEDELGGVRLRSSFRVWFPNWFRETQAKTGSLEFSTRLQLQMEAGYPLTESTFIYFSPSLWIEKQAFSGSASRGVVDAGQTITSLLFPVRAEISF